MVLKVRMANEESLIANGTSIHAGLRTRLWGNDFRDYDHDEQVGFVYIEADGPSPIFGIDVRY